MNRTKTTHLGIVVALAAAGRHDAASFCNAHTFCQGRHKRRATLATTHDGEDSGPLDGEGHLCFRRRGGVACPAAARPTASTAGQIVEAAARPVASRRPPAAGAAS
jgi:hypothetical protein